MKESFIEFLIRIGSAGMCSLLFLLKWTGFLDMTWIHLVLLMLFIIVAAGIFSAIFDDTF